MKDQDIRWIQRFVSFSKAFKQLEEAVILSKERPLTRLEEQGMIQAFEYYNEEIAVEIVKDIINHYFNNFILIYNKLTLLKEEEE